MVLIAAFIGLVFVYSLVSRRLERTILTAPILFTAAGVLTRVLARGGERAGARPQGLSAGRGTGSGDDALHRRLAHRPRMLQGARNLPVRLLSTGMLLTIVLGALCAMVVLGGLSWWEAGILAAILAPTDAGLGQVIVKSPRVPQRIRQALNVEAGLNDGLAVPFLMFFIALAVAQEESAGRGVLARFLVEQLGYGA